MEIHLQRADQKAATLNWNKLSNSRNHRKNYRIPTTIEEFNELDQYKIELKVNSRTWILMEEAEQSFVEIVERVRLSSDLQGVVSYQTIYEAVKQQLELELSNRETNSTNKRDFDQVFQSIQNVVDSKISLFEYFFAIDGLELKNREAINCGKANIFLFNQELRDQLVENYFKGTALPDSGKLRRTQAFFDDNFLNHVCVKSIAYGDSEIASRRAYKQAREIINYFRFIVCLFAHDKISQQVVRINISFESYSNNEKTVIKRDKDNAVILVSGRGRKPLQKFPIDEHLYQELLSNGFLEDFVEIINASSQTDIEGRILTAIYWIGEAQNEPDLDIAFLKYWTALECIFTGSKKPTEALAEGVTVINAFSEYRFIEIEDIKAVHSRIKKLYEKRSHIIHRGMNYLADQVIDRFDVSEICKYTAWSICSLFSLRAGYTTMSEIDSQISRLSTRLR